MNNVEIIKPGILYPSFGSIAKLTSSTEMLRFTCPRCGCKFQIHYIELKKYIDSFEKTSIPAAIISTFDNTTGELEVVGNQAVKCPECGCKSSNVDNKYAVKPHIFNIPEKENDKMPTKVMNREEYLNMVVILSNDFELRLGTSVKHYKYGNYDAISAMFGPEVDPLDPECKMDKLIEFDRSMYFRFYEPSDLSYGEETKDAVNNATKIYNTLATYIDEKDGLCFVNITFEAVINHPVYFTLCQYTMVHHKKVIFATSPSYDYDTGVVHNSDEKDTFSRVKPVAVAPFTNDEDINDCGDCTDCTDETVVTEEFGFSEITLKEFLNMTYGAACKTGKSLARKIKNGVSKIGDIKIFIKK